MTELSSSPGFLQLCWRYLVLGLIQGVTEFLPISSTAHLRVVPVFFGWGDPGVPVTAVIQLGSVWAVCAYFRNDLEKVSKAIFLGFKRGQWREPNARLGIAILIGTLPILFTGGAIKLFWNGYEESVFRSIASIGLISILMACLLALAEKIGSREKSLNEIQGLEGFLVGLGQVMALIPGVSRSGITLTTALLNGWKRKDAARFSFLLGIPAITIAGIVELKEIVEGSNRFDLFPLLVGVCSAAVMSWLSIHWLLKYLQSHSTWIFVSYRMIFGIALLAFGAGL